MSHLWKDEVVTSVAEYSRLFESDPAFQGKRTLWYRGESVLRKRNALLPSLARPSSAGKNEWEIYLRFRQAGAAFLPHKSLDEWDWMLYMRHYGAPTRLLDWSESPLVALYFAVQNPKRDRKEGAVWILDPLRLNKRSGHEERLYCASIDPELDAYTPTKVKGSPEAAAYQPVALIAPRSFPRLVAQQGVFTVTHRKAVAIDSIAEPDLLARIRVPAHSKAEMRRVLSMLGIDRLSLYPELQSLGEGQSR